MTRPFNASTMLVVIILVALLLAGQPLLTATATPAHAASNGWTWQNPLPQGDTLFGVWGSSGSDVFAVGRHGQIFHYNGAAWSYRWMTGEDLNGVWGTSSTEVFVAGGNGILHYKDY